MGKKDRERLRQHFDEHVARMTPADLTRQEIRDALAAAGCDPERLRDRLHQAASKLAQARYTKGRPAPEYLHQVIDLTGPPETIPQDAKRALSKAKQWIASFTNPPTKITAGFQVARALRKQGDLTTNDQELLDKIEGDLRRETEDV